MDLELRAAEWKFTNLEHAIRRKKWGRCKKMSNDSLTISSQMSRDSILTPSNPQN